jgi:hypothetical protein
MSEVPLLEWKAIGLDDMPAVDDAEHLADPIVYVLKAWELSAKGDEIPEDLRNIRIGTGTYTVAPGTGEAGNPAALAYATAYIILCTRQPVVFGAPRVLHEVDGYYRMRHEGSLIAYLRGALTDDNIDFAMAWWNAVGDRWHEVREATGIGDLALALWLTPPTEEPYDVVELEWHWFDPIYTKALYGDSYPRDPRDRQWLAVNVQTIDVAGALRQAARKAEELDEAPASEFAQRMLPLDMKPPFASAPYPQDKPGSQITISVPTHTPAARKRLAEAAEALPDLDLRNVLAQYPRSVELWLAMQHRFRRLDGTVRRDASFRPADLVELLRRPRNDGYVRVERHWQEIYENLLYGELVNVRVPTGLLDPTHIETPLILRAAPYRYEDGEVIWVDGRDIHAVQAVEVTLSQHMQSYLERGGWWHVPRELFQLRDETGRAVLLWVLGHAVPRLHRETFSLTMTLGAAGVLEDYELARRYGKGRRWIERHILATFEEARELGVIVDGDVIVRRIRTGRRGRPPDALNIRVTPVPFGERAAIPVRPALPPAVGAPWTGAALRLARREKGLTQAALGELVGVTQGTVARWEGEMLAIPLQAHPRLTELLGPPPRD